MSWVKWFDDVGLDDLAEVGGKNASLGELRRSLGGTGIPVPDGFAVTASAYEAFLDDNDLAGPIGELIAGRDRDRVDDLQERALAARTLIRDGLFSPSLIGEIRDAYAKLCAAAGTEAVPVAVRSSATAEDLPTASFAGQLESYLMVIGDEELIDRVRDAFASLFTARAIKYCEGLGFNHLDVAVSVGVQQMVRSDLASSGVILTLDPDSERRDLVVVTSSWGLGENVVQGKVGPDKFLVDKSMLEAGSQPIVGKTVGTKELRMRLDPDSGRIISEQTPAADRDVLSLADDEVLRLAEWSVAIEDHYSRERGQPTPMHIEWAKDGVTGELYIVEAETG